jgi:DNA-binding IclR family transcriptional regulator
MERDASAQYSGHDSADGKPTVSDHPALARPPEADAAGGAGQAATARRRPPPKPKEDRHFVTALARGLEVLACFRTGESTLSNQELAQRCHLPKSTVTRLTMTLTKLGYLIHVPESGRYRLGTACLALGSAMLTRLDVRKIARPMMQELASATNATVSLGVRDRLSMIYVENCRSAAALTLTLDVGSRIPVATSAIGRAWLAAVPEAERVAVLQQVRELDDLAWPSIERGIQRAMEDYRTLGVTCSFGDWQKDVNGIARAFDPGNGLPIMAINVGGPSFNLAPDVLLREVRPRLIELVARIEEAMPR